MCPTKYAPPGVWLLLVIFGLLGLAANLPHIRIFTGAALLFGGVFHLAVALLYGPFYGLMAP